MGDFRTLNFGPLWATKLCSNTLYSEIELLQSTSMKWTDEQLQKFAEDEYISAASV